MNSPVWPRYKFISPSVPITFPRQPTRLRLSWWISKCPYYSEHRFLNNATHCATLKKSSCVIVAKNLDKQDIHPNLSLHLRPLTNELGGRLDYGQPFCVFHAWCRCISKAFTAVLSLHACNAASPTRRSMFVAALRSAWVWKPHTTQQNVR